MCMSIFQSGLYTVITIANIMLSYPMTDSALEASWNKISSLPAKIRRVAGDKLRILKQPSLNCHNFLQIALLYQSGSNNFRYSSGQCQMNGRRRQLQHEEANRLPQRNLKRHFGLWFCNVCSRNLVVWDEVFQEKD